MKSLLKEETFAGDSAGNFKTRNGVPWSTGIFVRIYEPKVKILSSLELSSIDFTKPNHHYAVIRIGCELDPGNEAGWFKTIFSRAKISVPVWGDGNDTIKVFGLFPLDFREGTSKIVKLKLEPSLEIASVISASLGSIETDILVGQIAPSVVGFKGDHEMRPYWNLQHYSQSPIYGMRNFWLMLEAPLRSKYCFISCNIVTAIQTAIGPMYFGSKQRMITHSRRYKIEF